MIDDSVLQRMKLTTFQAASDSSSWTTLVEDMRQSY